ncbi:hypothetical protein [Neobacillus niacini]|uniref:hypothetical protein n=1 Tax=Neobacillus niacini TaxID=86668 RepID=UPI0021CB361B|nr:hypothetical protein [Neobacillus niacini]MCM3764919.1 hypothetical protein [Neobacillus niacini]
MMLGVMGIWSLLFTLGIPVAIVILLVWIYQIKRNGDIHIQQNNKIIQLLEKSEKMN